MIDETVRAVVAAHVSTHSRERLWEQYRAAAYDRAVDVCATIRQPFALRDVVECVRHVLVRDGWSDHELQGLPDEYQVTRQAMLDLESSDLIARIRYGAGNRAHLWVRADRGPTP